MRISGTCVRKYSQSLMKVPMDGMPQHLRGVGQGDEGTGAVVRVRCLHVLGWIAWRRDAAQEAGPHDKRAGEGLGV